MQAATLISSPGPSRVIRLLVIHCVGRNGSFINERDLSLMHRADGHDGPQFHHLIDLSGRVHSCLGHERIGHHARGWNTDSLGIALVGANKFSRPQWRALAELVEGLAVQYQIPLEVPNFIGGCVSGVAGHCDLPNAINRHSPNFSVRDWLAAGMQPTPEQVLPWANPSASDWAC